MPAFDSLSRRIGLLAAILGTYAASVYWRAGLSLSHYDAKAHLVVARRIFDSLTPSWEQIGAVWLPLPHVLNALPVQIDWMYRTGASAIAISIGCFALTAASLAQLVMTSTGSRTGALLAAALFALNPNVLYLQSTPMTEPLLFALSTLVVLHLAQWVMGDRDAHPARGRLDDRRGLPDALRGMADRRRGHGDRRAGEMAARRRDRGGGPRDRLAGDLSGTDRDLLPRPELRIDRPMVRDRRLLRARSEAAGPPAGGVGRNHAKVWSASRASGS